MGVLPLVLRGLTARRAFATVLGSIVLAAPACSRTTPKIPPPSLATSYLDDASFRRAALEASLVDRSNRYSAMRLAHYASGKAGDWDRLPEWNPPVDVIAPEELDAPSGASPSPLSSHAASLALPTGIQSEDDPRLVALGREAFARYPVQLAPHWRVALASRAAASRYGLWIDEERRAVGGIVRARMADGSGALMVTCATCHTSLVEGEARDGVPNAALDMGAAVRDAGLVRSPDVADALSAWGPGRVDVTTGSGREPARIPDLRPTRWLTYLQQDATVRARDLASLAIRLETLIIVSHNEVTRPPRVVVLGLAAYLESLGDALPSVDTAERASPRGAAVFESRCARCHRGDGLTGEPVAMAKVGTDATLGDSKDRGTGFYRVPSLRGVGTRGPLLHDGSVPSVAALFDAARPTASFAGRLHGAGAVPGHRYGLDLDDGDRGALVSFLKAL